MKLNIKREDLLKSLQRVNRIVEKRNTMPILSNILMEAKEGNNINITATDLEMFIKDSCNAEVEETGLITVNAKKILEIIRELSEDIYIYSDDIGSIIIKSGKAVFKMVCLPSNEFPAFPAINDDNMTLIERDVILEMIDKTYFAASLDEVRYNINGIYLENGVKSLKMVATDGHRLAVIERKQKVPIKSLIKGVILPRKGISEIRRLLDEQVSMDIFIGFTKSNCIVKKGDTIIIIRLIDGEFPDYKQVVPQTETKKITIEKRVLLSSLRRVSIFSSDKIKGVKFTISKNNMELLSSNSELGEAREDIEIDFKGEQIVVGFNARYIIDLLDAMDSEILELYLRDSLDPGLIRPENDEYYSYIIMPIRM